MWRGVACGAEHHAPARAFKEVNEGTGEEPDEDHAQPLTVDEATRKEILAEHPHDNAEDVLGMQATSAISVVFGLLMHVNVVRVCLSRLCPAP